MVATIKADGRMEYKMERVRYISLMKAIKKESSKIIRSSKYGNKK
jgi:hypothetical protein